MFVLLFFLPLCVQQLLAEWQREQAPGAMLGPPALAVRSAVTLPGNLLSYVNDFVAHNMSEVC